MDRSPSESRVQELFARLVSHSALKARGLLVELPPRRPLSRRPALHQLGDDPDGDDDGPPYGAAMAMPIPGDDEDDYVACPPQILARR
jgi:hypothetical protein